MVQSREFNRSGKPMTEAEGQVAESQVAKGQVAKEMQRTNADDRNAAIGIAADANAQRTLPLPELILSIASSVQTRGFSKSSVYQ